MTRTDILGFLFLLVTVPALARPSSPNPNTRVDDSISEARLDEMLQESVADIAESICPDYITEPGFAWLRNTEFVISPEGDGIQWADIVPVPADETNQNPERDDYPPDPDNLDREFSDSVGFRPTDLKWRVTLYPHNVKLPKGFDRTDRLDSLYCASEAAAQAMIDGTIHHELLHKCLNHISIPSLESLIGGAPSQRSCNHYIVHWLNIRRICKLTHEVNLGLDEIGNPTPATQDEFDRLSDRKRILCYKYCSILRIWEGVESQKKLARCLCFVTARAREAWEAAAEGLIDGDCNCQLVLATAFNPDEVMPPLPGQVLPPRPGQAAGAKFESSWCDGAYGPDGRVNPDWDPALPGKFEPSGWVFPDCPECDCDDYNMGPTSKK